MTDKSENKNSVELELEETVRNKHIVMSLQQTFFFSRTFITNSQ